jgi:hypothetical protein
VVRAGLDARSDRAIELMSRFAARTGLDPDGPQRRYLWTDAFAVCNFLGLARATGDQRNLQLALRLVDRVHHTLGRQRPDSGRTGWISGLDEREGKTHPTAGGLRIGKPLNERSPDERLDELLEWDRDGQYFHYLTKWMHALDQVARVTGDGTFHAWARELATVAHRVFVHVAPGGRKRMYWKTSIDLSRPLVATMGQHDPLDGLVTCMQLEASGAQSRPSLDRAIGDFRAMLDPSGLATSDPLGIGGLLVDAARVAQLMQLDAWRGALELLETLLRAAFVGLRHYVAQPDLAAPAEVRLAFRELGLAIGLAGVTDDSLTDGAVRRYAGAALHQFQPYASLPRAIESFWLRPGHRELETWQGHADINDVMLATALRPEGFLHTAKG